MRQQGFRKSRHRIVVLTTLLAGLAVVAPATAPAIEPVFPRIVGGTPVPFADQSGMVVIYLGGGGFCSGALLANDWVVTAAHCNVTSGPPSGHTVAMGSGPIQVRSPDFALKPPSLDFALLHLSQGFELGKSFTRYRMSPYSGSSFSLLGLAQTFYGYSEDGFASGPLRSAEVIGAAPFGAHNHGVINTMGQYPVPGDSGGPLVLETGGTRALTGINKCGFTECLARPETFRDWIYAQLYDRPMPFPKVWFLPFSSHPNFGAVPLQDSYSNSSTFTPCPDAASYTWSARYDLEPGFDTITVTTGLGATVLTGNGTTTTTGTGAMTVAIQTDGSIRSPGLLELPITCGTGVRFASPWPNPLPPNSRRATKWDPCPGGKPMTWSATYDFGTGGGYLQVGKTRLTGTGSISDVFAKKKVTVKVDSGDAAAPGIQKLSARCQAALVCHGVDCFTLPTSLPPETSLKTKWTPCHGGTFQWQAAYDVGAGTLTLKGKPPFEKQILTGAAQTDWQPGNGTLRIQLKTDVASATEGLPELKAICDAWGTPPKVGIQVIEATHGLNCNAYYGNVTYRLADACEGLASCAYTVPATTPDPAPGCAKDFVATYTCGADPTVKQVSVPGEASGAIAALTCP